ncbi:TetR family transcriptional regulator [Burkholderia pseudomallei]|nr:TetR family transcriptional regulator [Burkholderia pseudomallei]
MPTTVSAPETLSETRTQTRELLLQTALSMLEQGWFPSITELANASGVSRATAYRYFPSQAALVSTVVDESLGPVLQWQPTSTSVEARVNELLDFAYPRMEQHEGALRAALQVALHQWANERARRAQDEPKYRRGNRRRLLTLAVEPMVRAGVDPAVAERLAQALSFLRHRGDGRAEGYLGARLPAVHERHQVDELGACAGDARASGRGGGSGRRRRGGGGRRWRG